MSQNKTPLEGGSTHVMVYVDNVANVSLLSEPDQLKEQIESLIQESGMRIMGEMIANFQGAFQVHFALAESFVVVEPWPELSSVKLLVDICNFTSNNSDRAIQLSCDLADLFAGEILQKSITFGPF